MCYHSKQIKIAAEVQSRFNHKVDMRVAFKTSTQIMSEIHFCVYGKARSKLIN